MNIMEIFIYRDYYHNYSVTYNRINMLISEHQLKKYFKKYRYKIFTCNTNCINNNNGDWKNA